MNIKCTQNIYKSANGVSNVTYYILVPEGVEVRGIVQLSHGMCEYFSRYTDTEHRSHARRISDFLPLATAGSILLRMSST